MIIWFASSSPRRSALHAERAAVTRLTRILFHHETIQHVRSSFRPSQSSFPCALLAGGLRPGPTGGAARVAAEQRWTGAARGPANLSTILGNLATGPRQVRRS